MKRPWQIGFGIVLTGLAGFVDAIGFIRLGGLYTSLMSGNTTQLAVALGHRELDHAILPALLLLSFLVGAIAGGAISALTPSRWATPVMLGFETLAVAAAFVVARMDNHVGPASLLLALAMGTQNAVLGQVQGFRAGATFVTGALFAFGQKLTLAILRRGPRFGWVGDGSVWLALLVGAVAGTVAHTMWEIGALAVPALIAGALCVLSIVLTIFRQREAPT